MEFFELLNKAKFENARILSIMNESCSLEYKNRLYRFQQLIGQLSNCEHINVNFNVLENICNLHQNRFTNFYGYWEIGSSKESKLAREFIQKYIKQNNPQMIRKKICEYMQDIDNSSKTFFLLLFTDFNNIFYDKECNLV